MFKWIKETLGVKPKKKYSQELMKATALYIQLVKSSIIESLCVEECLLVPETSSSNQKIPLMFALCSYFAARTDFELEQKFVSPDVREGVWSSIIDMVFEDMLFIIIRQRQIMHIRLVRYCKCCLTKRTHKLFSTLVLLV